MYSHSWQLVRQIVIRLPVNQYMEGVLVYIQPVVNRATRQSVGCAARTTEATLSLSDVQSEPWKPR